MKLKPKKLNLFRQIKLLYLKLYRINDSPEKIAQGLGVGVFLGIMPGVGIIAALIVASLLKLNRISILLGTLITNTWLSFATFILSIKIGSAIMGLRWQEVYRQCLEILKDFHWINLFKISLLKIILPVVIGYIIISVGFAIIAYIVALITIKYSRKLKERMQHV